MTKYNIRSFYLGFCLLLIGYCFGGKIGLGICALLIIIFQFI